jgi:hypothetical protein
MPNKTTPGWSPSPSPVVVGVFENFIEQLAADASIGPAIAERVRQALLTDQDYSVEVLKAALFSEDLLA